MWACHPVRKVRIPSLSCQQQGRVGRLFPNDDCDLGVMPLQKRQVFLMKSSGPMMFDLILDGMNGFWQLRDAHTESAITLLPAKVVQLSKSLVNPGR
jgi:hypothetical protein